MSRQESIDDSERLLNEQLEQYERLFGKVGIVHHSPIPLFLGGQADVREFPDSQTGVTYVTKI